MRSKAVVDVPRSERYGMRSVWGKGYMTGLPGLGGEFAGGNGGVGRNYEYWYYLVIYIYSTHLVSISSLIGLSED